MATPSIALLESETMFAEKVTADSWKTPQQAIGRQVSGKAYFTNQRVIFLASGLIETTNVSWQIEMKDILSVHACMTPPFFPFGILITMKDGGKYKLGIMKRKKYIDWITQHIA